ncbi:hypothetical protein B7R25_11850 [Subtercola boreus]|uniref:RNA-directed DNA polymerase n=2 Tax=Subtercola boreus TaxID=120213 RepID=A0A3E0WAS1_9MICO|nr:hypothetical protein B7R24_11750 [Subtercola boreus]RFA19579.1 hypothetical protein B7R23_11730 [Subtercola boreus]RFA25944.1 hypothetical protein B7R25_11850 [Subtercola boreus]
MLSALQGVFGARHRWLPALVREVRSVYRTPPQDAPRELAAIIRHSQPFLDAVGRAEARGRPLAVLRYPITAEAPAQPPVAPGPTPATPGPIPATPAALAALLGVTPGELDWLADVRAYNRRARPGALHLYRYEWRLRPGRCPRLLEVPTERMRRVQRTLLHEVLALLPVHHAAHGFVTGRSALTGARVHSGSAVVISLDLTTFFARVTAAGVYGSLRRAGFSEAVATTITGLTTNRVPPRVISAMPPGGGPDERFALRQALATAHLPQGAPTSPALANGAIRRLDARLEGYAAAVGARYTRYADDLVFSGPVALQRRAEAFVRGVTRLVDDEGHEVNPRKSRVSPASTSQRVTGIVVNTGSSLPREEFDRLKALLHNCATLGPASQNRAGVPDFRAHLLGRISYSSSVNPLKTRRLIREFNSIDWGVPRE